MYLRLICFATCIRCKMKLLEIQWHESFFVLVPLQALVGSFRGRIFVTFKAHTGSFLYGPPNILPRYYVEAMRKIYGRDFHISEQHQRWLDSIYQN